MDLTKSDMDEGEVPDYSPPSTAQARSADPADGGDAYEPYEPPTTINMQQSFSRGSISLHKDQGMSDDTIQNASTAILPQGGTGMTQTPELKTSVEPPRASEEPSEGIASSHSHNSLNNIVYSDGYEPPQPVSPADSTVSLSAQLIQRNSLPSDNQQYPVSGEVIETVSNFALAKSNSEQISKACTLYVS